jgi:hypothetical protein
MTESNGNLRGLPYGSFGTALPAGAIGGERQRRFGMINRIMDWFTIDPEISLLMAIAAVVIFASGLARKAAEGGGFWPWLRRIVEASVNAILFLGLLWAFRSVLNSNFNTFFSTHGSRSDLSQESAYTIWGRPHTQNELTVTHSIEVEVQEEIPREDPSLPPLYRTVRQRQEVPQNSIQSFRGEARMTLSEREKGYAYYSGFLLDVNLIYAVLNDSEYRTEADFYFPLSPGQTLFTDFTVTLDGRDIGSDLRFSPDMVSWSLAMAPHRQILVEIAYASRGMDFFFYRIPNQRYINDFEFTLTVDRLPTTLLNYPNGVLAPSEIQATPDGRGSILTWRLNQAVTTAGMGVALISPEQPGEKVLRVLAVSPYAVTMLGAILALTLLILGYAVNLLEMALLVGVYSVEYLVMAGISDFFFGFWGSLIIGAALTLFLAFLLFRKFSSRLVKVLLFCLIAFFTVLYPLSGLLDQIASLNSFNAVLQAGMIVFLFGLSLFSRLRSKNASAPA